MKTKNQGSGKRNTKEEAQDIVESLPLIQDDEKIDRIFAEYFLSIMYERMKDEDTPAARLLRDYFRDKGK